MEKTYISTRPLADRLDISTRTLYRRMKRRVNPMPSPVIKNHGASNLWLFEDILEWEAREMKRTARLQMLERQTSH